MASRQACVTAFEVVTTVGGLTKVAEAMGSTQSEVSRSERRQDHLVSTLREYVRALGGELELTARFGDKSIRLHGV